VKSALETLNPTRVKMTVEVPYEELKPSLDTAYKTIGQQIQVPGFRKGKVPARIIDQRVGRGAVLQEAVNEALPKFYGQAIDDNKVRPLGQPDIDVTEVPAEAGQELKFTAEVDVRPEITLPDYAGITVEVDEVAATDEDIDERLLALRQRFGTLKGVERAVEEGDFVSLDLSATINGEQIDAVTGVSYEVGSKNMLEGLDEALLGMTAEETKSFTAPLAGGDNEGADAECVVTVQSVKERELPELDDDFAQLASEFDTLSELRADVTSQAEQAKKFEQGIQARDRILLVEDDPSNRDLTTMVLSGSGFRVDVARDGQEGLQKALSSDYDLVLMDVQLPGIDGLTLTRMLKSDPRTAPVPVVALSANAMKGDEQKALAAGCVGYIAKPIDVAGFAKKVAGYLETPTR